MKSKRVTTDNPRETRALAKSLAESVLKEKPKKSALVVGLLGDLGAGKTTFIKAFIKALGVKHRITSPTFLISRRFGMPKASNYENVFHVDAYRIAETKELKEVGIDEVIKNPGNIVLIEWADRVKGVLPKGTVWVKFKHGKREEQRHITIN